jgi:uncharacterized protein
VTQSQSPLRLNVGFIVHQTIGYIRDFDFNIPKIYLEDDLLIRDLSGVARITRTPQGLLCQVKVQAGTTCSCVRCLEDFDQSLAADFSELYAFNQRSISESGLILPDNGYIDLTPLVREFLLLEIPINPLCRTDCRGLCSECGANLNTAPCEHQQSSGDSRLGVLEKHH